MIVECSYCHQPIADECLSPDSTAVTCPACEKVADYRLQLGRVGGATRDKEIDPIHPAALPRGWLLEYVAPVAKPGSAYRGLAAAESTLLLSRRWAVPRKLSIIWLTAFVLSGLCAIFARLDLNWLAAICFVLLVPIWGVIAVNRTTFLIDDDCLRIRHTPVPWSGHQDIARASLKQLFCQRYKDIDGETTCYEVCALLPDGPRRLVGGFEKADDALHIRQLLAGAWQLDELTEPGPQTT